MSMWEKKPVVLVEYKIEKWANWTTITLFLKYSESQDSDEGSKITEFQHEYSFSCWIIWNEILLEEIQPFVMRKKSMKKRMNGNW